MNTLVLNGYMAYYLLQNGALPRMSAPFIIVALVVWVSWIAVARVYMGEHLAVLETRKRIRPLRIRF